MKYHFNSQTRDVSVAEYFAQNGADWKGIRLQIQNILRNGNAIQVKFASSVQSIPGNKYSLITNKILTGPSYIKFSLNKEEVDTIKTFVEDEDIIVIDKAVDRDRQILHVTFTRSSLIKSQLETLEPLIRQDYEYLTAMEEKRKQEQQAKEDTCLSIEELEALFN
ncbi:hypothetical protein [Microbulbifer pacificus]|uniref:hypothetical protein n=1 Tax=Microbulbifer pacificus TaxID=407164 RepID=UPI000CF3B494|nr:hypothetical protein [Microbulbifer pacificus]